MNKVNPMAMMLSGVLMLRWIGETAAADRVENAIAAVIAEGKYVTYDLKPEGQQNEAVGTSQVADAIIAKDEKSNRARHASARSRRCERVKRERGNLVRPFQEIE